MSASRAAMPPAGNRSTWACRLGADCHACGAEPRIRTENLLALNEAPLPVGLDRRGADDRDRTGDLDVGNVALWPAELHPHGALPRCRPGRSVPTENRCAPARRACAGRPGLEPGKSPGPKPGGSAEFPQRPSPEIRGIPRGWCHREGQSGVEPSSITICPYSGETWRALPQGRTGPPPLQGAAGRRAEGQSVSPVRFERTLPSASCWCLLPLGYEDIRAATRCRSGSPALRGRGRSRARRQSYQGWNRTSVLLIQSQGGMPATHLVSREAIRFTVRAAGVEPAPGRGLGSMPLRWATPACAARASNPVPRIKSPLHHPSCLRRAEPHRGIEHR
jgi:hypothetical protein